MSNFSFYFFKPLKTVSSVSYENAAPERGYVLSPCYRHVFGKET